MALPLRSPVFLRGPPGRVVVAHSVWPGEHLVRTDLERRYRPSGGAHLYGSQQGELFLRRKMLQCCSCIYTIMIGDSNQAKLLTYQVIDQLFGHPCAIAESGMHLEINSSISRQDNRESEWFHERILSISADQDASPYAILTTEFGKFRDGVHGAGVHPTTRPPNSA